MYRVRYKYCVVPECRSTTFKTPGKLFFSLPSNTVIREKWCKAMGRVGLQYKELKSNRFCCEDHFDIPNDMANYMECKILGVKRLKLKKGVIPHKFDCQVDDSSDTECDERKKVDKATQVGKIAKSTPNQQHDAADWTTESEDDDATPTETYIVKIECESDGSEYEGQFEL